MPDWKETLNLPKTGFRMKASLPQNEPLAIARWDEIDLYGQIRRAREGAPKFILHDGPPYANGEIHLGTALNKILKDFVIKSRTMAGLDAPYLPGWDCHGLPIELQVDRKLGKKKRDMSIADVRRECRHYAEKHVSTMREDFKRLGILGAWEVPYLTMNYAYQATIVLTLGMFVEQGLIYRGKKPVHWCTHCRTALAEAEVEYRTHESSSIFVEFPLAKDERNSVSVLQSKLGDVETSVLIWTTTPWTIPSNLAVAFHPDLIYAAYKLKSDSGNARAIIVAEQLADRVASNIGVPLDKKLASFSGRELEGIIFRHPLYDRDSIAVLGDYVTLEQGTGAVHTAPGHGADDFNTGKRYGLDIYAPVGPGGQFFDDVEMFAGLDIFDANPKIETALSEHGRLWHRQNIEHSYPHCWRCHRPVIFLATSQWFIKMDQSNFRQKALTSISQVEWFPAWGEERIRSMVENRPDWCISRQRSWGVPIPALYCTSCHEATLNQALTNKAAKIFAKHGADAWYESPLEDFVPEDFQCHSCGNRTFERERDILDVWFDSGSSHEAVLAQNPTLKWPANLYLEGSDQHRGWFHSSLLVGIGSRNAAPFEQVVTHGFVVDESGHKMSKSLGNTISPKTIIKRNGAEILRLWAAMVDYREEMRFGDEILARVIEAYRKIRNTLRILVGNLYDFEPSTDSVATNDLQEIDRYALARYGKAATKILDAYDRYEFQTISHTINHLLTVDLSAFYIDISKDSLYTRAANSTERRSTQTVIYTITDGLTRLLAPILPITTDDLWNFLPGTRETSVHIAEFPTNCKALVDHELLDRWERLESLRETVNFVLEKLRNEKIVGTSLEAAVHIQANGRTQELIERYKDELPTLFITSEVTIESTNDLPTSADVAQTAGVEFSENGGSAFVTARRSSGIKCQRCWRYVPSVSTDEPTDLCTRCIEALAEKT